MQVHEAARPSAKTVRNQREMQNIDQLQRDHAQRNDAGERTNAEYGALGHFSEERYP